MMSTMAKGAPGTHLCLMPLFVSHSSLSRYQQFKDFQRRILVATNLFGRGMDIERVNIVFNYDMPEDSDTYLHRVSECPLPVWVDQGPSLSQILKSACLLTPSPCRWLVLVALVLKAWRSLLYLMRMMPKSSMMFRTGLK